MGRSNCPMEGRMNVAKYARLLVAALTVSCLFLPMVYGQAGKKVERKEYNFKGKVEKINTSTKILTVAGDDVPGWMGAMTMDYGVDRDEVLKKVKVGDRITAK